MSNSNNDFELLNNFAHDLKTPLAAVKHYIELMAIYGELNEKQTHFHNRAQQSVERIQRIVTALLDYSRVEQNRALHLQVCDLYKMVETTVNILEAAANEKNLKIIINIPVTESQVYADPLLLEHALSNLIINAIKYNKQGGKVIIDAADAGSSRVRIDISDTGLGIPKEDQDSVWDRFYRVDRRNQASIEGTGLGLAIVKGVVEKHGGKIRLQSTEGQGTTFTFTIPRPHGSSQEIDQYREPADDVDDKDQEGREHPEDVDSGDTN